MYSLIQAEALNCRCKIHSLFKRVFKEQAGGAELIATIVIIGIVLILAFAFKDKIMEMVAKLWDGLVKDGKKDTKQSEVVPSWN